MELMTKKLAYAGTGEDTPDSVSGDELNRMSFYTWEPSFANPVDFFSDWATTKSCCSAIMMAMFGMVNHTCCIVALEGAPHPEPVNRTARYMINCAWREADHLMPRGGVGGRAHSGWNLPFGHGLAKQ
jgi:hypothetical protein